MAPMLERDKEVPTGWQRLMCCHVSGRNKQALAFLPGYDGGAFDDHVDQHPDT